MPRYILVTGGAGFIGSHICKALARAGMVPVTYDNLSTGHIDGVRWGPLIQADIADGARLRHVMAEYSPDCVIHCGANAYVGESVEKPSIYYRNNVIGSLSLLDACLDCGIDRIVFSSSCATYGIPRCCRSARKRRKAGQSLWQNQADLRNGAWRIMRPPMVSASPRSVTSMRPAADPEGQLAERHYPRNPSDPARSSRRKRAGSGSLDMFGTDYSTDDGTCVRDYIHVSDLAEAHLAAVRHLLVGGNSLSLNRVPAAARRSARSLMPSNERPATGCRSVVSRAALAIRLCFSPIRKGLALELDFMPTLSGYRYDHPHGWPDLRTG